MPHEKLAPSGFIAGLLEEGAGPGDSLLHNRGRCGDDKSVQVGQTRTRSAAWPPTAVLVMSRTTASARLTARPTPAAWAIGAAGPWAGCSTPRLPGPGGRRRC
eukprot:11762925-Alexandrium_andersonii.AAC.1